MNSAYNHTSGQPKVFDVPASPRTVEQLQTDLRTPAKLYAAVLGFTFPAEPAHMGRLLPGREDALHCGAQVLAAIQRVHRISPLREDTYVRTGTGEASVVTTSFPIAEVSDWSPALEGDQPVINAVIRFASDPIAPRTSVKLTIGYHESVDGTQNLVYRIRSIGEEEAQDPQAS